MTHGQPYEIVHLTTHWRRLYGAWYRDAWIRVDGDVQFVAIRDDQL